MKQLTKTYKQIRKPVYKVPDVAAVVEQSREEMKQLYEPDRPPDDMSPVRPTVRKPAKQPPAIPGVPQPIPEEMRPSQEPAGPPGDTAFFLAERAAVQALTKPPRYIPAVAAQASEQLIQIQEPAKQPPDFPAAATQTPAELAKIPRPVKAPIEVMRDYTQIADEMMADKAKVCQATDTTSPYLGRTMMEQCAAARLWPDLDEPRAGIVRAFKVMEEIAPHDPFQGRLAIQMIATNDAALTCMNRAMTDGQTIALVTAYASLSTSFMRLYLQQNDAMQKMRGKAPQVNVDQVHVHDGGQAIVGTINTSPETRKK
jgi:hypothetical protein